MESKVIFLVIILLLIPYSHGEIGENAAKEHLLIYEASPYPYAKTDMEYVCIFNPLNVKINLNGYFITDFEGKLILHGSITPNSKIYIAQNSSSFLNFMGFYPNYTYAELKDGKFSLANKGDEIALYNGSKMVDMVIYGNSKYNGTGWIGKPLKLTQGHIIRRKNLIDTNTPKDWSTYHVIGQSDFKPEVFKASLEIFPYPDKWKEVLRFTKEAKSKILIESYTMDSLALEKVLEEKLKDGVEVNILLDGSPIGG
ncbi:TPA: phospholipase, partial [Candidatus Aciduliprofundum boonei]|nr:phospholipase [Candidatus Aciduliprofundum boonei]